jgi:hypothetical protein
MRRTLLEIGALANQQAICRSLSNPRGFGKQLFLPSLHFNNALDGGLR